MKVQYPILIEKSDDNIAWGIIVPDLPGCFSAADEEAKILDNAREAILLHLESLESVPEASKLSATQERYKGDEFVVSLVDVDLSQLEGPAKRINVTIPANILTRIDAAANRAGMTRSAFLADAALKQASR